MPLRPFSASLLPLALLASSLSLYAADKADMKARPASEIPAWEQPHLDDWASSAWAGSSSTPGCA